MLIDCDTCAVRGPACGDCVVTFLLAAPPVTAGPPSGAEAAPIELQVELDAVEQAAIAVLAGSGLVPPLRLVPGGREHDGLTRSGRGAGAEQVRERRDNSA